MHIFIVKVTIYLYQNLFQKIFKNERKKIKGQEGRSGMHQAGQGKCKNSLTEAPRNWEFDRDMVFLR